MLIISYLLDNVTAIDYPIQEGIGGGPSLVEDRLIHPYMASFFYTSLVPAMQTQG